MATTAPTKGERRIALALLAASVALVYLLMVHPLLVRPLVEVNRRIGELQERNVRIQRQLRQADEVEQRLQEVGGELTRRPAFLPERSAELASAALARRLEVAVLAASPGNRSCAIGNRSALPSGGTETHHLAVSIRVQLRCGTPELATVLHSLESGRPRLFVDNFNIFTQADNGLEVGFDLTGYLAPSGAAKPLATAKASVAAAPRGTSDAN